MAKVRLTGKTVAHGNGTVRAYLPDTQAMRAYVPPEPKLTYVIFRCLDGDSPRIKTRYDFFACPWKDSTALFNEYTEELEAGVVANLSLQVVEWTAKERDAWFEQNEVEVGG